MFAGAARYDYEPHLAIPPSLGSAAGLGGATTATVSVGPSASFTVTARIWASLRELGQEAQMALEQRGDPDARQL